MTNRPNEPKSTIRPAGGFSARREYEATISPENSYPVLKERYKLTSSLVGKIENIARARYTISKYVEGDLDVDRIWSSQQSQYVLAATVNASSEIEGEEISAAMVPLVPAEATEVDEGAPISVELAQRLALQRDIHRAYLWTLRNRFEQYISLDFILEIHKRMFENSESVAAGKFKEEDVVISGALYSVDTLAKEKTREYVEELCDRTNKQLAGAREEAENSRILIVAEFVLDFLAIHPFRDGNGRAARLISTYLLERLGYRFTHLYPIDAVINERRPEYYEALFLGQQYWYTKSEDLSAWINFYVEAVYEQWMRAHRELVRRKNM